MNLFALLPPSWKVAPELRAAMAAMSELLQGAELIGPADPPAVLVDLFAMVGAETQMPPELLAAVASQLSNFDVAHASPHRIGVMGLPLKAPYIMPGGNHAHVATVAELGAGEASAIAALEHNVRTAAELLVQLRIERGGLAAALVRYCELGVTYDPKLLAGDVVLTFLVYLGRSLSADGRTNITTALAGLAG